MRQRRSDGGSNNQKHEARAPNARSNRPIIAGAGLGRLRLAALTGNPFVFVDIFCGSPPNGCPKRTRPYARKSTTQKC